MWVRWDATAERVVIEPVPAEAAEQAADTKARTEPEASTSEADERGGSTKNPATQSRRTRKKKPEDPAG